ncbi:MAG TPA: 50S ribosomal protein L3 [candidate division WOR-3 bacterium]|uniref:Large ribosomal subunit protein uL3 n=1 Tax=candidate division WOR-3 bacterium TaxID=2052148 RepID=A0A7V5HMA8_UNCW3|nr:50S ribosomal protein L3 [candidate division WOR-3 bacterium]
MMIGLIGRKLGMTQIPTKDGSMTAVTVIEAGPCYVLQGKTVERDGYNALKIGFGEIKARKLNKPILGELKKIFGERESYPALVIKEIRTEDVQNFKPGQELKVDIFQEGEKIDVTGISKGKGFQGVMKRWGFSGGPKSHGSKFHRRPGSIGQHTEPARVWKGKKMAGHAGMKKVTVKNLEIMKIYPEKNLVLVKGAIPGPNGGIVVLKTTKGRSK